MLPHPLPLAAPPPSPLLHHPLPGELLAPPLRTCLASLLADTAETNELVLAAMAGLLGRTLLSAPPVFSSLLAASGLPDALPRLAARWLQLADSILLSTHRKLAAVALGQMLSLDASLLPLAAEILSFAVSVLYEHEPQEPDSPPRRAESARFSHEHAEFAAALDASGLDPVRALELRPTLQQCMARAAAAHGAPFHAAMQALDPDLMAQVQKAFGS